LLAVSVLGQTDESGFGNGGAIVDFDHVIAKRTGIGEQGF
jgi:hypothetical protein